MQEFEFTVRRVNGLWFRAELDGNIYHVYTYDLEGTLLEVVDFTLKEVTEMLVEQEWMMR